MLADTDLVLLDIKAFDTERHRRVSGAPVEPTLRFAEKLSELKKPIWVRFVLVPALTDDEADVERLAKFVASLASVERVEVLPFHKMGEPKWEAMRLDYQLRNTPPPTNEIVDRVQSQFRRQGLLVF
jgi:pyruvate formate lyase activating enzyme